MEITPDIINVVQELVYLIGKGYPVWIADKNYNEEHAGRCQALDKDMVQTLEYKCGRSSIKIGQGLLEGLQYIEQYYGIDFNQLEQLSDSLLKSKRLSIADIYKRKMYFFGKTLTLYNKHIKFSDNVDNWYDFQLVDQSTTLPLNVRIGSSANENEYFQEWKLVNCELEIESSMVHMYSDIYGNTRRLYQTEDNIYAYAIRIWEATP